jgi:hypothetical protein
MPTSWTLRLTLALVFLPLACADDGPTENATCTQDSDCSDRQRCVEGTCRDDVETATGDDTGPTTTGDDAGQTTTGDDTGQTTTGADACEQGGNVCLDENTLGMCNVADQSTTVVSCDDWCASMGFSAALGCNVATQDEHQCYCDQATATCTESTCGGGLALAECIGGMLDVRDCQGVCQADGLEGDCRYDDVTASLFCDCAGPFPCTENNTFCQDAQTEMFCTNGVWQPQPCSDEACHAETCLIEFADCPADYQARTLGCGYDSYYGDMGCLCTS